MASACWSSRLPNHFSSGAVCARKPALSSPRCGRNEKTALALALARRPVRAGSGIALSPVDLRASRLVDLVQPFEQRIHESAARAAARKESRGQAAAPLGGLREDLTQPEACPRSRRRCELPRA